MKLSPRRRIEGLSVCLVLAAVVVLPAQATRPDDRATRAVGTVQAAAIPDVFERAAAARPESSPPDVFERAAARGPLPSNASLAGPRPDDRASSRGPGSFATSSSDTVMTSEGFSWDDALVGASAMLGLCLLTAAGALVATRRRSRVAFR